MSGPPKTSERDGKASMLSAIETLCGDEGSSVRILCPNPDPCDVNHQRAIEVNAYWTQWQDVRFDGKDLSVCLLKALMAAPIEVAVRLNQQLVGDCRLCGEKSTNIDYEHVCKLCNEQATRRINGRGER